MAKNKETNLSKNEIKQKIKDLKMELIKSKATVRKGGKVKMKEMKRTIARLLFMLSK